MGLQAGDKKEGGCMEVVGRGSRRALTKDVKQTGNTGKGCHERVPIFQETVAHPSCT